VCCFKKLVYCCTQACACWGNSLHRAACRALRMPVCWGHDATYDCVFAAVLTGETKSVNSVLSLSCATETGSPMQSWWWWSKDDCEGPHGCLVCLLCDAGEGTLEILIP
jgi:hypothetical protein